MAKTFANKKCKSPRGSPRLLAGPKGRRAEPFGSAQTGLKSLSKSRSCHKSGQGCGEGAAGRRRGRVGGKAARRPQGRCAKSACGGGGSWPACAGPPAELRPAGGGPSGRATSRPPRRMPTWRLGLFRPGSGRNKPRRRFRRSRQPSPLRALARYFNCIVFILSKAAPYIRPIPA